MECAARSTFLPSWRQLKCVLGLHNLQWTADGVVSVLTFPEETDTNSPRLQMRLTMRLIHLERNYFSNAMSKKMFTQRLPGGLFGALITNMMPIFEISADYVCLLQIG